MQALLRKIRLIFLPGTINLTTQCNLLADARPVRTAERELVLPLKPPPADEVAEQLKFDTLPNKFHPPRTSWRQIVELRRGRQRALCE